MSNVSSTAARVIVFVCALVSCRIRRFEVDGESMLRAFKPGDRVLAESWSYRRRSPRIGEAVIVRQPGSPRRNDLKRIIAGPGATVVVRGQETVLGPDQWFVVGDNLNQSTDSRDLGPVSGTDIVGRVMLKY